MFESYDYVCRLAVCVKLTEMCVAYKVASYMCVFNITAIF